MKIYLLDGRIITVKVLTFHCNSKAINLHSSNYTDEWVNVQFDSFEAYYEQLSVSGLQFRRIQDITLQTTLTNKTRGEFYIKTPAIIANKKESTVNIKNINDDFCIICCLLA